MGSVSTLVALTGNGPVSYTLAGLLSDGLTKTVTVLSSATACGVTSLTYTAPASCTLVQLASLGDKVFVDNNGDGIQQLGTPGNPGIDTPLGGVIVTLNQQRHRCGYHHYGQQWHGHWLLLSLRV